MASLRAASAASASACAKAAAWRSGSDACQAASACARPPSGQLRADARCSASMRSVRHMLQRRGLAGKGHGLSSDCSTASARRAGRGSPRSTRPSRTQARARVGPSDGGVVKGMRRVSVGVAERNEVTHVERKHRHPSASVHVEGKSASPTPSQRCRSGRAQAGATCPFVPRSGRRSTRRTSVERAPRPECPDDVGRSTRAARWRTLRASTERWRGSPRARTPTRAAR